MRKSLAHVALSSVFAFAFSALSLSSAQAMPAPEPGNIELGFGVTQWGAESEAPQAMNDVDRLAAMLEKSRPREAATTKTAMCETLATAAQIHDLPVGFFVRLINQESRFKPDVVSHAGAQGVAQFMPKVAQEWGLRNPFDPHAALIASARFLRSLYQQFGNWGLAAAAYNGGMGRVQKWIDKRGPLPDETRHYVKTITGVPAEKWVGTRTNTKFSIPARAPCQEIAHLADSPEEIIPLPPTRSVKVMTARVITPTPVIQQVSGPASKTTTTMAAISAKAGMKVAIIKVKTATQVAMASGKGAAVTKVAAVTTKIAVPPSIIADEPKPKAQAAKAPAATKLADKSSPKSDAKSEAKPQGKPQAKAADAKNTPAAGRVQVADARATRK